MRTIVAALAIFLLSLTTAHAETTGARDERGAKTTDKPIIVALPEGYCAFEGTELREAAMNAFLKATLANYGAIMLKGFTTCHQRAQVRDAHLGHYPEYFVIGAVPAVQPPKPARVSAKAYVAHLIAETEKHGVRKATQSLMHWPKDGVVEASSEVGLEIIAQPRTLQHDATVYYLEYRAFTYVAGVETNIHAVTGITYVRGAPVAVAVYSRRKVGTKLLQSAVRANIRAVIEANK